MKKMLLLCTGLLLAAGIASAQVTSKNIVGYVVKEGISAGFQQITSPFISVLDENQKFTLDRISGNFSPGDTLQFLLPDGSTDTENIVTWLRSNASRPVTGWYYDGNLYAGTTPVKAGTGIILNTDDLVDIIISGQVETENMAPPVLQGFTGLGNSSPVTIWLEDILFDGLEYGDTIQFISPDGSTDTASIATWLRANVSRPVTGWYADGNVYVGDKDLLPGAGFTLLTESDEVTVVIPAPIL